jgi:hypothetical protein
MLDKYLNNSIRDAWIIDLLFMEPQTAERHLE